MMTRNGNLAFALACALAFAPSLALGASEVSQFLPTSGEKLLRLAEETSCAQKCENARQSCFQGHLTDTTAGGKGVTPEGAKLCHAAYRDCMKHC